MTALTNLRRRLTVLVSVSALVAGGMAALTLAVATPAFAADPPGPQPVAQRPLTMATADVLPTVQIDGVVWSQAIKGNTVYAGGQFANARPAGAAKGTNLTPRGNLLAYDITTGKLNTGFAPSLNGAVQATALSPDGSKLYVGGLFSTAQGQSRGRLAAYDTATGALLSWAPWVNYQPRSIVATASAVYVAGSFQTANGAARNNLAAFNTTNGALLAWNPNADLQVNSIVMTPDKTKIIAGGNFSTINGSPALGLAALDPTTGAMLPWAAGNTVYSYGSNAGFWSLSVDNDTVYGTGWNYNGTGNIEGTFAADASTGNIRWVEDCHGDTYGSYSDGNVVYTVSHAHYCEPVGGFPQSDPWSINQRHALVFTKAATGTSGHNIYGGYTDWYGTPAPTMINWFADPDWGNFTSQGQAAWNVYGNGDYVVMGGEFPSVSGIPQQGLVRFAKPSLAPRLVGPQLTGSAFIPTLAGIGAGKVRVSWTKNYDRDDLTLTYKVYRNNGTTPVYTTTGNSTYWNHPTIGFIDANLTPGSTYTYKVTATDGDGNVSTGNTVSIVAPSASAQSPYSQAVVSDGAAPYWRLGEASGNVAIDSTGFNDGLIGSGVTRGATGAIINDPNTATTFGGTSGSNAITQTAISGPDTFTVETWIKTTSTSGGKIIGFGNSNTGDSSSYDRHVYMDKNGAIFFGVYPGGVQTLNSPNGYNDGNWHHVVASLGSNGMRLYVDDVTVGSRTDVTSGQPYSGYWKVGGDNLGGWPNQPASNYLAGSIDDVAIYPTVLTRAQVDNHFVLSGRPSTLPKPPADPYGAGVFADNPALYWRLGESTGLTAADSGPNGNTGAYFGGVTKGVTGAIAGTTNTAATFNGSDGLVASSSQFNNPTTYSEELWFKTTTTSGGKLIGFGSNQTGPSGSYDRHVYMEQSGQLTFGTWTGQTNTITSPSSYNNGQWHHLVVSQASDGMKMYVDGALVGTNPQTAAQAYSGYWRVGGDTTWNGTTYFQGSIDDVAVYNEALTASRVARHYSLGTTGTLPNQLPTASFTATATGVTVAFDGSASSDPDGSIAGYSWDFGDGSAAGNGATPSHSFPASGTYNVTLTVTDNSGGKATATKPVAVTHAAPTANFTQTVTGLSVALNAAGNTTSDNATITGYSWDFGDSSPLGSGVSPTHGYTAGGTYNVKLTVTDSLQGTKTSTVPVTVAHAAPVAKFTSSATNLNASFDASTSTAADGATITGYVWDFGDGATGTGKTPTHTYASGGSKSVKLTVTDSLSATGSTTSSITVAAAHTSPTAAFTSSSKGLDASFDASTSTAADGATITGYAWDFGDGATGTGKTPTHTYASGGSKSVKLTVTDSLSATGSTTSTVVVTHAAPTAAFTSSSTGLNASFDASTSTAADGATITGYVWDFGDGATGTGKTPTHTYASGGSKSVKLTVTDSLSATGSTTSTVAISTGNISPTASFTYSVTNMVLSADGSGSSDPDGTIASYVWDFGDGSQLGSGSKVSHSYATAGNYTVKLTVADDKNATNSTSKTIAVTVPAIAMDQFSRIVSAGWGPADIGGQWTVVGTAANFSVANGVGKMKLPTSASGGQATLGSVSKMDTDTSISFTTDMPLTGNGVYFTTAARRVGSNYYGAKLSAMPNGQINAYLVRSVGGRETTIAGAVLPGVSFAANSPVRVRFQVAGTGTTTLKVKAWKEGAIEPAAWAVSTTDSTAVLQTAGGISLIGFLSGTATNAPITVAVNNMVTNAP